MCQLSPGPQLCTAGASHQLRSSQKGSAASQLHGEVLHFSAQSQRVSRHSTSSRPATCERVMIAQSMGLYPKLSLESSSRVFRIRATSASAICGGGQTLHVEHLLQSAAHCQRKTKGASFRLKSESSFGFILRVHTRARDAKGPTS